ncbi:hypothetical protein GCM10009630_07370 [Kribbella jejuensis]|uniref:Uncharacterized protein n=1 Tax=Kribbella jejuensis TaxID=236068 RepID=A0A542EW97_9ACTN|nr:hypothetical protein [Kribbella jejuensis]TQJ19494.1 hypothetical protein FB475_3664 [Kribbella jejuensis]
MIGQHIAGLPVEEVLLAALAAAGPVIALAWLEVRARIKRLTDRRHSSTSSEEAAPGAAQRDGFGAGSVGECGRSGARLRDYEFGGSESGQGVDG